MKTFSPEVFFVPSRSARRRLQVVLMASLCLCACKKPEAMQLPPPIVEVMEITTSEVPLSATLIGQLDSPQNVEVRARVEAFVKAAPFVEGRQVEKDQLIFELDKAPFEEKLKAAEGALAESVAALGKYQADVNRLVPLYEKRAIPKQDLDNAEASVDVGKAGVQTAQARVDSALLDLSYCEVRAPITGLIGAKQVSIGDLVGKGEPTLLATISTLDPIWFYCNVSEVDYLKAEAKSKRLGKEVEKLPLKLILSGSELETGEGHFVFIDRAVDVKTGTLRVRAEFPNRERTLRPGMFARARVDLGTGADSIVIPQRALIELQGKSFVWVVDDDNIATQRSVTPGDLYESGVLIKDGLKPGERIILEGIQKAREGAPVNALTTAQVAAMQSSSKAEAQPDKE